MSRIGKRGVTIPETTEVTIASGVVTVKGPAGTLSRSFKDDIAIARENDHITFTPKGDNKAMRALWGTYASHVKNMIAGVNKVYEKKLIIEGVGYKADVSGNQVVLAIGFSHPVKISIPEGAKVTSDKGTITVSGPDKEVVGHFAALLRSRKPPEPYKGKGIHYEGEVIRRKQGKRAA